MSSARFHAGEIAVQTRFGVADTASRVARSVGDAIPAAAREFLGRLPLVIIASRDDHERPWASALVGAPGFLGAADAHTLRVAAAPRPGDPLAANLATHDEVGVLAIDLATRRRLRVNGRALPGPSGGFDVRVEEAFWNCPKYIQARELIPVASGGDGVLSTQSARWLTLAQQLQVGRADTFFIATQHARAGLDASHRGGGPGFVRVDDERRLTFPDYAGNRMYQTLGNLELDPRAGLLFVDFASGDTLQLTGRARVCDDRALGASFEGAERVVEFTIHAVIGTRNALALRAGDVEYSPFNP